MKQIDHPNKQALSGNNKRIIGFIKANSFYFLIIGLFLIIISPNFLSDGMFVDGIIYSTISHNLANGYGTFWNPMYTFTDHPVFHSHPPLAFGIQSLFYDVFGDSRYIEKIYSLLTYVVTAIILLKIWKALDKKNGWIVLLTWLITPVVFWASTNNLLENTMMMFTTLSAYFYVLSQKKEKKFLFLFLSGFMLSFGFLTKGPVAFFPLVLPFFCWLFLRKNKFGNMLLESAILLFSCLIPLFLLIILSPDASESMSHYFNEQIIKSLKGEQNVQSRFFIIKRTFFDLCPSLFFLALAIILRRVKKEKKQINRTDQQWGFVFLFTALSGVIPVMISLKQSLFYVLATFPFFALSIALFIHPTEERIDNKCSHSSLFGSIAVFIFVVGIIGTLFFSGKTGRDETMLKDVYAIGSTVPSNETISITKDLYQDWSFFAYLFRHYYISIDRKEKIIQHTYFITSEEYVLKEEEQKNYRQLQVGLRKYRLYQKINDRQEGIHEH